MTNSLSQHLLLCFSDRSSDSWKNLWPKVLIVTAVEDVLWTGLIDISYDEDCFLSRTKADAIGTSILSAVENLPMSVSSD